MTQSGSRANVALTRRFGLSAKPEMPRSLKVIRESDPNLIRITLGRGQKSEPVKPTIQNVLRRILEHYFTILGNMDKERSHREFEGRDQQMCATLVFMD